MIARIFKYSILLTCVITLSGCELLQWHMKDDIGDLEAAGFVQRHIPLREGGSVSYWRAGQGKPLILLHGFAGDSTTSWKQQMLSLKQDYDVIAVDLPWFGDSFSAGEANLTTSSEAIVQVMEKLNLSSVNLVGASYGGFIASNLLFTNNKIAKTIIIASPGPYFTDQNMAELNQRFAIEKPEDLFVPKDLNQLRRLFNSIYLEPIALPDFLLDQMYQDHFTAWHKQRIAMIQSLPSDRNRLLRANLLRNNQAIQPEVMIIWGQNDRIYPLATGIEFSKKIQAPLVILPNTGHAVSIEQPQAVINAIQSFIN